MQHKRKNKKYILKISAKKIKSLFQITLTLRKTFTVVYERKNVCLNFFFSLHENPKIP